MNPQGEREDRPRLHTDEQLADYQEWFDNKRRLRFLLAELEALSLAIADADPSLGPLNHAKRRGHSPLNLGASPRRASLCPGQDQT